MIEISNWQLKVCIRALRVMADQEKNDSTFGSVLLDLEQKLPRKSIEELLAEAGDNYQQAYEEITNSKP